MVRTSWPRRTCCSYRCLWKEHSFGEEDPWADKPSECQIGGWRAVSAAGLQGKGSPKKNTFFKDTGMSSKHTHQKYYVYALNSHINIIIANLLCASTCLPLRHHEHIMCVRAKETLLQRRRTLGPIGFQSTKSGAGGHFLLEDCKAKTHVKEVYSEKALLRRREPFEQSAWKTSNQGLERSFCWRIARQRFLQRRVFVRAPVCKTIKLGRARSMAMVTESSPECRL